MILRNSPQERKKTSMDTEPQEIKPELIYREVSLYSQRKTCIQSSTLLQ
ncbi:hypothetical protein Mpsy_1918 [Methanolobus psychrophilus R15]|nr:hypothetical protein Mpsy_1918 [Methanolobus psychrophilus R15]